MKMTQNLSLFSSFILKSVHITTLGRDKRFMVGFAHLQPCIKELYQGGKCEKKVEHVKCEARQLEFRVAGQF